MLLNILITLTSVFGFKYYNSPIILKNITIVIKLEFNQLQDTFRQVHGTKEANLDSIPHWLTSDVIINEVI